MIEDLPVGMQQRVEIIKALASEAKVRSSTSRARGADPAGDRRAHGHHALAQGKGTSIVFITHKLREVKAIGDRITVIRRGKVVGTAPPSASETELAEMMVRRAVKLKVDKDEAEPGDVIMEAHQHHGDRLPRPRRRQERVVRGRRAARSWASPGCRTAARPS